MFKYDTLFFWPERLKLGIIVDTGSFVSFSYMFSNATLC